MVCTLRPGTKSVMTFHSGGFPSSRKGRASGANSLVAFVLRRFDGLIAVNEEIMGFFQRLRVSLQRTRLISPYSFVPNENAAPLPSAIADFFDAHDPVVISAGQLEPEYDLAVQIEALSKIRSKFANAGLLLLGSGTVERELREKIEALNCQKHVMLAGDVPHNATIAAMGHSDLMLRTTLYDGDAISVREALQVGTPVIATDNAMRPCGVTLVPKSDLAALVFAIEIQLARPKNREARSRPDDANLQAVFDFYQELLAGN
jgi:glycogen(starch) synthase